MATPNPYGTTASLTLSSNGWSDYRPEKMRIKCNAKWTGIRVISGFERAIYENYSLDIAADEYFYITFDWRENEDGFMAIEVYRDSNDPTPGNVGAVVTKIEFGPEEKLLS
jgi:hypothetical protein